MGKIQDKLQGLYKDEEKSREELLLEDQSPEISDIPEKIGGEESEEGSLEEQEDRPDVSPAGEKAAEEKYGNVDFADETNKKYPIDKEHIHAAVSYFGMPKNYDKYSLGDRKTIASKIAAAAKKFGVELSDDWKKKHNIS